MRLGGVPGLGAAVALVSVTLAAFGTLQNAGPESVVRRFHRAVANRNAAEIAQVVDQPNASASVELVRFANAALAGGGNFRIVTSERGERQVQMLAFYANGARAVWVVSRPPGGRWRIDTYLTLQGLRRMESR